MSENKKIQSEIYNKHILDAFKKTPLTYSGTEVILNNLLVYKEKAIEKFQNNEAFEAACIVKSLIEKSIEQLEYIEDSKGHIGKFLFEIFDIFPQILKEIIYDKKELLQDLIKLLHNEDLGFTQEISTLIFNLVNNDDIDLVETLLRKKISTSKDKVKREKVTYTLISFYQITGQTLKFFEACQSLPKESWERYYLISTKLEEQHRIEKAKKVLEEGIRLSSHYRDLIKEKYEEFKLRHNIQDKENELTKEAHVTRSSDNALFEEIAYDLKAPDEVAKAISIDQSESEVMVRNNTLADTESS